MFVNMAVTCEMRHFCYCDQLQSKVGKHEVTWEITRDVVLGTCTCTRAGVKQAMKNWEGKFFLQLPHTIPVCPPPPLIGGTAGTCHFCPPVKAMHTVPIMSLKAIIIIISIRTKSTNTEK